MLRTFHCLSLFLFTVVAFAQDIQWASHVIKASPSIFEKEYAPKEALGTPNTYPLGGTYATAYTPIHPDKKTSIHVGFEGLMYVQQVIIVETCNPGAVLEVFAYDSEENEYNIASFEPKPVSRKSRMLRIMIPPTDYEVLSLKIVLDGKLVPGYNAIDAVGISNSRTPYEYVQNLSGDVNPNMELVALNDSINSEFSEIKPVFSPDGKIMYFSRAGHPDNKGSEDIWLAHWDEEKKDWVHIEHAGDSVNNNGPNFISSITPDGENALILFGNKYSNSGRRVGNGVSIAHKTEEGWSKPKPIKIEKFHNESELAYYFLASDGVLLMSLDRRDGHGSRDIYVSFKKSEDLWSEPQNIGPIINTSADEDGPYLASDGKTMYFSSTGHSGFGLQDIFVTRRLDDTWLKWSEPENLGSQINTEHDEMFFNMPENNGNVYFCRGDSSGRLNIFSVPIPEFFKPEPIIIVNGTVRDKESNDVIAGASIHIERKDTLKIVTDIITDSTGAFHLELVYGTKYNYTAIAGGYKPLANEIDLTVYNKPDTINSDLLMDKVLPVVFQATSTNFGFDSYDVDPNTYSKLDSLAIFLSKRSQKAVLLKGHTDSTGPEEYNMGLSNRRANAVKEYLLNKGVSDEQVVTQSFGEAEPIATNKTKEGRAENRRVELEVIDKDKEESNPPTI